MQQAPFHFINLSLIWSLQKKKWEEVTAWKHHASLGSDHEMFYRSHSRGYLGLCSEKTLPVWSYISDFTARAISADDYSSDTLLRRV